MRKNLLFIIGVLIVIASKGQTFNGTGGRIPDYSGVPNPTYFPCVVSGLPTSIDTVFGLERVCIHITHPYDEDLQIQLMSPDSFITLLSYRHGGNGRNYIGTCFRGNGANGLISSPVNVPPYTGEYDSDSDLYLFNNGRNPNGTWNLIVTDLSAIDSGYVNTFSIVFSNNPTPHCLLPCSTTNVAACRCPDGTQDCDLLPDMTASSAALLNGSNESGDTIYVDNATPNIGWGPLEVHGTNQCFCDTDSVPCTTTICPLTGLPPKQLVNQTIYHKHNGTVTTWTHPAGTMTYHPSHGHIHLDGWTSYSLRKPVYGLSPPDWPIIGQGYKQSYCLFNSGECDLLNGYCVDTAGNILGQVNLPNSGMGTVSGCGVNQGIYVGNYDVYTAALSGQWIVLDSICNGNYAIVSITDPNNVILESNENNNWASIPFTLTQQLSIPFPTVNFTYAGSSTTITFTNTSSNFDSVRWDFGDGISDTALNPIHTYSSTGTFNVVLTAYNQCGFEQHVETFTITMVGISEAVTSDVFGFKVYPNPASTQVKIDFGMSKRSSVLLQLFDAYGNLIRTLSDETLNMGSHHYEINATQLNLSRGVYTIKLTSSDINVSKRIVFVN